MASAGLLRRFGCPDSANSLIPRFINTTTFVASIFGSGEARRGSIPRSGAVTEEQRSQNRKATQPSGRRFFLAPTALLTPYRPRKGMRVARASSGPKIPRRKRGRIYEMEYLGPRTFQCFLFSPLLCAKVTPSYETDFFPGARLPGMGLRFSRGCRNQFSRRSAVPLQYPPAYFPGPAQRRSVFFTRWQGAHSSKRTRAGQSV